MCNITNLKVSWCEYNDFQAKIDGCKHMDQLEHVCANSMVFAALENDDVFHYTGTCTFSVIKTIQFKRPCLGMEVITSDYPIELIVNKIYRFIIPENSSRPIFSRPSPNPMVLRSITISNCEPFPTTFEILSYHHL